MIDSLNHTYTEAEAQNPNSRSLKPEGVLEPLPQGLRC